VIKSAMTTETENRSAVVHVWAWFDGEELIRVLADGPNAARPADVPEHANLVEQDAEAWWDEIIASGRGRRWLKPLADVIGDGRKAIWTVSARQIRLALRAVGLRDAVEQAVAASSDPSIHDWWEYSIEYDRHHPIVAAMLPALSAVTGSQVTEAMADNVWELAETL
jgi:hypothetical protein